MSLILIVIINLKVSIILIDRIISQVTVHIIHIFLIRFLKLYNIIRITFSCESDYTIIVQIHSQRVDARDEDIYSHIELEAIDQIRVHDVLLNYFIVELF